MSHWEEAKTQMKDIDCLIQAAGELGLQWVVQTTANVGYATLDNIIGILVPTDDSKKSQAIGVRKEKDGTHSLHTDWMFWYMDANERRMSGKPSAAKLTDHGVYSFGPLIQRYNLVVAEKTVKKRGLTSRRVEVGGNKINLHVGGMA